ncbi:hypothetical protein [Bradyrhizobium elkanii]|uniref:hypothetical protein n=1 Tax=Bradyrhizobium elkanii TaxID=29448 RepID=UPI003517465A
MFRPTTAAGRSQFPKLCERASNSVVRSTETFPATLCESPTPLNLDRGSTGDDPRSSLCDVRRLRPSGQLRPSHFAIRTRMLEPLQEGEVLLRPVAFRLIHRIARGSAPSLTCRVPSHVPGQPLSGPAVARVVGSRHPDHAPGALVASCHGQIASSGAPNRTL